MTSHTPTLSGAMASNVLPETKHTPGRWTARPLLHTYSTQYIKKGEPTGEWEVVVEDASKPTPEERWFIATVFDGAPGSTEANARLIARAPDLLAENERLREALTPQPIDDAPKGSSNQSSVYLLGWCPDDTAPSGGDWRVVWWEPQTGLRGVWWGDRDLREHPTHWLPYPAAPAQEGK